MEQVVGGRRAGIALLFVWIAVWLPLVPVLAGAWLPIPDDIFASDLVDYEWPVRVVAGEQMAAQGLMVWTPDIGLGTALWPDPWVALYAVFPPVPALGVHLGLLLTIAAGGSFLLAREHGAGVAGAVVAGLGYAWSGYFASQIKHLYILGVVAWLPLALLCIERAAADRPRRIPWSVAFALVFGMQVLASFPQSAYYSAIVCGALVAARMIRLGPSRDAVELGACMAGAVALGAVIGLPSLLPMLEAASLSDRSGGLPWEEASQYPFWEPSILGIVFPYPFGDISRLTFRGSGVFWEQHGYIGGLAAYLGAVHLARGGWRTFEGRFWAYSAAFALLFALGPATPLFWLAWEFVPGMGGFRFPTRALFVTDLALVQLAAHGVGLLDVRWRWPAAVLCAFDVAWFNSRQVPMADAERWLASPTADLLADRPPGRLLSRGVFGMHTDAFVEARGWADLEPYYRLRAALQPNSNLLYDVPAVTGYISIAPRGAVDLVGDHTRDGILQLLDGEPVAEAQVLDLLDVRYVVTEPGWPVVGAVSATATGSLALIEREGAARVRVVRDAVTLEDSVAVLDAIRAGTLDLRTTAVLPPGVPLPPVTPGTSTARISADAPHFLDVAVDGDGPGILVVADTAHPGWAATLDGAPVEILTVDLGLRGIPVPAGPHEVTLTWAPAVARRGMIACAGALAALAGVLAAWGIRRRAA